MAPTLFDIARHDGPTDALLTPTGDVVADLVDEPAPAPAPAAEPLVEELTIDGDATPFVSAPTRHTCPAAPAPTQLGLFATDAGQLDGQTAMLDQLGAIPAVPDAPAFERPAADTMPDAELIAEYREALAAGSRYRQLSDLVAHCVGTPADRVANRIELRRLTRRREQIAKVAKLRGLDLLAD